MNPVVFYFQARHVKDINNQAHLKMNNQKGWVGLEKCEKQL